VKLRLQRGEQLDAQRERWGTTRTVRERFADKASAAAGVRDKLRYNTDEVGVGLREGRKVVCLKDMKLFRIKIGK
jgi:predicted hydrolase (HD superfamily)